MLTNTKFRQEGGRKGVKKGEQLC